jgi:hypothetical protein
MKSDKLRDFMEAVIGLSANVQTTGMNPDVYMGPRNPQQQLLGDTKRSALIFADEYRKPQPDHDKLKKLSQELEANLSGLCSFAVIDTNHLDKLLNQLHEIFDKNT